MVYENDTTFLKGKSNENKEGNIYFIVGEKKSLIPPSYKNFIEWGSKNIFSILKPFRNKKYTFNITHMKKFCITCIKMSSDGKFIIIGYDNGVLEKYKLKKVNNCFVEEEITILTKQESKETNNNCNSGDKNKNDNINAIKKYQTKGKNLLKNFFGFKKTKAKEKDEKYNNISSTSFHNSPSNNINDLNLINKDSGTIQTKIIVKNHIVFNPKLSMSASNILNSESFLLNNGNCKFIQYNSNSCEINKNSNSKENIEGYFFHSKVIQKLNICRRNLHKIQNLLKKVILFF